MISLARFLHYTKGATVAIYERDKRNNHPFILGDLVFWCDTLEVTHTDGLIQFTDANEATEEVFKFSSEDYVSTDFTVDGTPDKFGAYECSLVLKEKKYLVKYIPQRKEVCGGAEKCPGKSG